MHAETIKIEVQVPDGYKAVGYDYVRKGQLYVFDDGECNTIMRHKSSQRSIRKYLTVKKK